MFSKKHTIFLLVFKCLSILVFIFCHVKNFGGPLNPTKLALQFFSAKLGLPLSGNWTIASYLMLLPQRVQLSHLKHKVLFKFYQCLRLRNNNFVFFLAQGVFIVPGKILAECGSVGMMFVMWIICGIISLMSKYKLPYCCYKILI